MGHKSKQAFGHAIAVALYEKTDGCNESNDVWDFAGPYDAAMRWLLTNFIEAKLRTSTL